MRCKYCKNIDALRLTANGRFYRCTFCGSLFKNDLKETKDPEFVDINDFLDIILCKETIRKREFNFIRVPRFNPNKMVSIRVSKHYGMSTNSQGIFDRMNPRKRIYLWDAEKETKIWKGDVK